MKRILTPLFFIVSSFSFHTLPASAQEGGAPLPVGDAAVAPPPDVEDGGDTDSGKGNGTGGGAPVIPPPKDVDTIENHTKACSVSAPGRDGGSAAALLIASAALGAVMLRRTRR